MYIHADAYEYTYLIQKWQMLRAHGNNEILKKNVTKLALTEIFSNFFFIFCY